MIAFWAAILPYLQQAAAKLGPALAKGASTGGKGLMSAFGAGGGTQSPMALLGQQLGARAALQTPVAQYNAPYAMTGQSPPGTLGLPLPGVGNVPTPGGESQNLPQFGGALASATPSLPSSMIPSGGASGGPGGIEAIIQKVIGDHGSMRRDILKAGLDAYSNRGAGGGAGAGGGGGVSAGLLPPGPTVSVPPSTYAPVASGAEGFGGAGAGLATLVPKVDSGMEDQGDFARRVMALALAQRSLGGGAAGGGYPGMGGIL